MKNKKRIVTGIIILGIFLAGIVVSFVVSASTRNILKDGVAIVARSWRATFGASSGDILSSEIDISGADPAQDTPQNIDDASDSAQIFGPTTGDTESVAQKAPKKTAQKDPVRQEVSPSASSDTGMAQNSSTSESMPSDASSSEDVSAVQPSSKNILSCATSSSQDPSHKIILNEVAWMGALPATGETASKASGREWLELKNISGATIHFSGWQIVDAAGNIKIIFDEGDAIAANGFFLLERGDDAVPGVTADTIYAGALPNSGDTIFIFDDHCVLSDVLDASAGWPGGDNIAKDTLERDANGFGWHMSALVGGTPRSENSPGPAPVPVPVSVSVSGATSSSYAVSVLLQGDGRGMVMSTPPGVSCGGTCIWGFSWKNTVTLRATPDTASVFGGWSGICSGMDKDCTFVVNGPVTATALFHAVSVPGAQTPASPYSPPPYESSPAAGSSSAATSTAGTSVQVPPNDPASTSTPGGANTSSTVQHLVIAMVQIAGASSTNDFVKLFNPTASAVDISGWKLRKKAGTGSDQSLRELPDASIVAPSGYFVWANSAGGFSELIGADVSSTATLAAGNSVALFDASSTIVDAVAWGNGTDQYVEGSAYPTNPTAGQTLKRIFTNTIIVDTDNNANDFTL